MTQCDSIVLILAGVRHDPVTLVRLSDHFSHSFYRDTYELVGYKAAVDFHELKTVDFPRYRGHLQLTICGAGSGCKMRKDPIWHWDIFTPYLKLTEAA